MMMLTIVITVIVLSFTKTSSRVLIYNIENGQTNSKFDCVYHAYDNGQEIPYCRRIGEDQVLNRLKAICMNDGVLWSFHDLIHLNISPNDVLDWSSSVEMADIYTKFFYNHSLTDDNDRYLCNCTKPGTFGKFCEYQLTHGAKSFSDAVEAQFEDKRTGDSWNTQEYGQILCYTTLMCDSGLMCLDWREIGDGMQRCFDGLDEENSDKLEFNECEVNEFRCTNGMCIPEEFWLDGHVDCMDWSDELIHAFGESCSFTPNAMKCDEHICPRDSYSCGDGQCVDWFTRIAFQQLVIPREDCFNKRNLNHMCEVSPHQRAWTLPNGLCWPYANYDDPLFPPWNMVNSSTLNDNQKCQYLLRCALSDGLEHDCPCKRRNCTAIIKDFCSNNSLLIYPSHGLIYPNVLFYYNYNQFNESPIVDGLLLFGSHRCRGYRIIINQTIIVRDLLSVIMSPHMNNILCTLDERSGSYKDYTSTLQYDKSCYNGSLTFIGHAYASNPNICSQTGECISRYRIHDGTSDCFDRNDENINFNESYCKGTVGQHHFQCFNDEHKCLPLSKLGTDHTECSNGYDQMWYGGVPLRERIKCEQNNIIGCDLLKEYIRQSSKKNLINYDRLIHWQQQTSTKQISFRSYCDSFWDLQNHRDESSSMCREWWICRKDQYQCQTGQCIELDWVCDGEWDCADASDEEGLSIIKQWSVHNSHLADLRSRIDICQKRYSRSPFSDLCDISTELGCYLSNVPDPLNIQLNRPCIRLTQIGDGVEDCYNAYDEKNTLETNSDNGIMWGFHFRCENDSLSYSHACLSPAKSNCTNILCSNHRSENELCSDVHDVICLDGQCVKNGRCNGQVDCSHGEDEYWCSSTLYGNNIEYRSNKKKIAKLENLHLIPRFPSWKISDTRQMNREFDKSSTLFSYICNRGVAVLEMNEQVICLCPPAYYGRRCEFYSDRISVIAQFDQRTLLTNTLKIKGKLFFHHQLVDEYEFTIMPAVESQKAIKHQFYLIYSRSKQMLAHKQHRYFNRSDIITNHPYSVHFDVFSLEKENQIKELGSWHYPIYFDYLPAYRLAVVFKFPSWFSQHNSTDVCSQNVCNRNSICLPIFNRNNSYYCSCKNGFYGDKCELYQEQCQTSCSSHALCQNSAAYNSKPSCICPLNYFGPQCNLKNNACDKSPCENNGSCLFVDDHSGEASYRCICSKRFYGDHCQYELSSVHIDLNMTYTLFTRATVIQLYDFETSSFQLRLQHQRVYHGLPLHITYGHSDIAAPSLGLLKIYENFTMPKYFIMYVLSQVTMINMTSSPQYCPHTSMLLSNDTDKMDSNVFKYHLICQNDSQQFCFHDENYLCICHSDHYQVECFNHDTQLEHCNNCLSGGTCLHGDPKDLNDFICLCSSSYYGLRCEFSLLQFNTTISSSSTADTMIKSSLINMSIIIFIFVIGLFKTFSLFNYI